MEEMATLKAPQIEEGGKQQTPAGSSSMEMMTAAASPPHLPLDQEDAKDKTPQLSALQREDFARYAEELQRPEEALNRRLIRRTKPFRQSPNKVYLEREPTVKGSRDLLFLDPFHTILSYSMSFLFVAFTALYIAVSLFFGIFYWMLQGKCNTDWDGLQDAYLFSIETQATIGYGASDVYFDSCFSMVAIITVQTVTSIVLDALAIGLVFERFSAAYPRASRILFSDVACLRHTANGELLFQFQLCELSPKMLLGSTLVCIAYSNGVDAETQLPYYFRPTNMRIKVPDDEIGEQMALALPATVTHSLSIYDPDERAIKSPLVPADCAYDDEGHPLISPAALKQHWEDAQLEVVCLVMGTDEFTGNEVQAKHSFTAPQIFAGNYKPTQCVFPSDPARLRGCHTEHSLDPRMLFKEAEDVKNSVKPHPNASVKAEELKAHRRDYALAQWESGFVAYIDFHLFHHITPLVTPRVTGTDSHSDTDSDSDNERRDI